MASTDMQDPKSKTRAAPKLTIGAIQWLRENLFSSWVNTILTVLAALIIYKVTVALVDWAFIGGIWEAENRRECLDRNPNGACWAGVIIWFNNIIYGRYTFEEQWRINLSFVILVLWLAPLWMPNIKGKMMLAASAVFLYPFLSGYLFAGGERSFFMHLMVSAAAACFIFNCLHVAVSLASGGQSLAGKLFTLGPLQQLKDKGQRNALIVLAIGSVAVAYLALLSWQVEVVPWTKWGGLFLTLVISGIGITTALPGGIVLALGRRSQMPVIRIISMTFIELFRSVPLITILFMATTMFPLFLPEGVVFNKLAQVIVAVCLFSACYMAETVRGGLQAIPKGQYEAAYAMGLNYWGMMGLIVMPQALKYMIPNIVGSFIGLLKDTTLVSIIGLFDLLNMLKSVSRDVPWRGLHKEPLMLGAVIFFVICYAMSRYSRHLENKLDSSHR